MTSIFKNVDELIDRHLGVEHIGSVSPHYGNKAAANELASRPDRFECQLLLTTVLDQMRINFLAARAMSNRQGSSANWRLSKESFISERNTSKEKICEKRIVRVCGDDWFNQMPTASGLIDGICEKHCNIDLVFRNAPDEYTFFELKHNDKTPLFAAFEIVKYGLLYVLSRQLASQLGYLLHLKPVLAARVVHLCVLAPKAYYESYELGWLQREISEAMGNMIEDGWRMDFSFRHMNWPNDDNEVANSIAGQTAIYRHI